MKNKGIRFEVSVAITSVALLTLFIMGIAQYSSEVNLKKQQIIDKSMISLQPVLSLATRNINGGNLMNLKNTGATDLYETNEDLLYVRMSGKSAGIPRTAYMEAIPPMPIEYTFKKDGTSEELLKELAVVFETIGENEHQIDTKSKKLLIRRTLEIKNGGTVEAVFSASSLDGVGFKVLKKVLLLGLLVFIGAIIIANIIGNRLARPIIEAAEQITDITQSLDLTKKVNVNAKNEVAELAQWFNKHLDGLRDIISAVGDLTANSYSCTNEISSAIQQQTGVTTEQSASVSEITSTMEELSASSTSIANHSSSVVELSTKALQLTEAGVSAVEGMMNKMEEIKRDNSESIQKIVDLGSKSKEITKVMEIINTIADQTKLIAFNAALEASSAGEAGKRFGIVAVEIRRLADSVMESTEEIENKISEIQQAVSSLVTSSEKGSKGIDEGIETSSHTSETLSHILTGAQSTVEAAKQISLSTQQQKTASDQVVVSLREIAEGSKQTSDSIMQINNTTIELSKLSDNLKDVVDKFKVAD